jgi:hypothetical protein
VLTLAMLDRILHHSTIDNVNGKKFRLKDKRKASLAHRRDDRKALDTRRKTTLVVRPL